MKKTIFYIIILIASFSACKNNSIDGNWYYLDKSIKDSSNYSEAYIDSNRISFVSWNYGPSPILHFVIKDNEVFYDTTYEHPAFRIIDIKKDSFVVESWISYTDSIETYRSTFYRLDNSVKGIFHKECTYDTLMLGFEKRYEEYLINNKFITREELEKWKNDTTNLIDLQFDEEIIPITRPDPIVIKIGESGLQVDAHGWGENLKFYKSVVKYYYNGTEIIDTVYGMTLPDNFKSWFENHSKVGDRIVFSNIEFVDSLGNILITDSPDIEYIVE